VEWLLRVLSFLAKLASAGRLLKLAIGAGAILLFYVVRSDGSVWELVWAAALVLGALVGAHLLVARLSGDDNVWESMSTRSIDLQLPREEAAAHVQRVLSGHQDTQDVQREGFTITCRVGSHHPHRRGWDVTASVRDGHSGRSEVIVDVEPREVEEDIPLDFGRGHRIAASIEAALRLDAAEAAR
jgi:hypothetical protein